MRSERVRRLVAGGAGAHFLRLLITSFCTPGVTIPYMGSGIPHVPPGSVEGRRDSGMRRHGMKMTNFKSQYRKFRMLTARFFSYWFFILFATAGVAIAVMERFTNVLGVEHLEPLMILILAYAILVYLVTERAKVLDDIHENLQNAKAEVFPTRDSVYMSVP